MPRHFSEQNKGYEDGLTSHALAPGPGTVGTWSWKVRASVTCSQLPPSSDPKHQVLVRCHTDKVRASSVGAEGGKLAGFLR